MKHIFRPSWWIMTHLPTQGHMGSIPGVGRLCVPPVCHSHHRLCAQSPALCNGEAVAGCPCSRRKSSPHCPQPEEAHAHQKINRLLKTKNKERTKGKRI